MTPDREIRALARDRVRERKCKVCRTPFTPRNSMQSICHQHACAVEWANRAKAKREKAQAKAQRQADRAAKEKLKTWSEWNAEAQDWFNRWVRERDHGLPCICCGGFPERGWLTGGEWDAGHYRSRGSAKHLRFDPRNCHAQLKRCNRRSWDVAGYRANLIERIGLAEVEALEADQEPRKYTIPDLRALRDHYRAETLRIRKERRG